MNKIRGGVTVTDLLVLMGIMVILALLFVLLVPADFGHGSHVANRSACGASLTGIAKALDLYAASNADRFPVVMPPAVLGRYSNQPKPTATLVGDGNATLASYYAAPYPQAGDPSACLWALVLAGNVSPRQFICKSDPTAPAASDQTDADGKFYDNFGASGSGSTNCFSYSFAYPWTRDAGGKTTVGAWWTATVDSSIPLGADMAPLSGSGGKDTTRAKGADPRIYNSANHGGEGQNVVFADTHVEYVTNPYVGQGGDNIWTTGSGASQIPITTPGITPVPLLVAGTTTAPGTTLTAIYVPQTFDIVMVPVRNAATGKL